MMMTPHLGDAGVHPVVASAARELLNKSDNERSGVLSTAMSFLGLYRDPVIAHVTRRCDWRIADLIDGERPTSLYLVIPPSDISRTKPLIRLILNQIGRRLTEELNPDGNRHRVLLMLDEFPALGRLDFFESALAFMAGYGLKAFLIAQSLNQIEKAYGQHNSILDNCHVRVAFATNDNETAKRVLESLGTATEMRAMKNYAGHRLSPWLGHLMVSRSETSRPLLTQGEILQLPETDEVVMIGGTPPIRAKKAQYYIDARLMKRILPPPMTAPLATADVPYDDWTGLAIPKQIEAKPPETPNDAEEEAADPANAGVRREPQLPQHQEIIPRPPTPQNEFQFDREDMADDEATRNQPIQDRMRGAARQASLDPGDGIAL
jgi:type IV secretion system protein VirD4